MIEIDCKEKDVGPASSEFASHARSFPSYRGGKEDNRISATATAARGRERTRDFKVRRLLSERFFLWVSAIFVGGTVYLESRNLDDAHDFHPQKNQKILQETHIKRTNIILDYIDL